MGQVFNRRRYMGGGAMPDANAYVQDGIIFQLDGIKKGNDVNAWTDLIGGVKFAYVNGVTPFSDHVNFASGHSMFQADTSNINWPFTDCTLEICLDDINNMMLFDSRSGYMALGRYSNGLIFGNFNTGGKGYYPTSYTGLSTLSISLNSGYQNGNDIIGNRITYWGGGGDGITIGSRGSGSQYSGNIYAIRVYNRVLTQEEAIYNYNLDNERFNISK